MKLVCRAGLKEIVNSCVISAGKNKHDHSSNISTQTSAVHTPIMLGGCKPRRRGNGQGEKGISESRELGAGMDGKGVLGRLGFQRVMARIGNGHNDSRVSKVNKEHTLLELNET